MEKSVTTTTYSATLPDSRELSALAVWRVSETPPYSKAHHQRIQDQLEKSCSPASNLEFVQIMGHLVEFASNFGIDCKNPEGVYNTYRDKLGDFPKDLLAKAVDRCKGEWKWGNRMPFPKDIKDFVHEELMERTSLKLKSKMATRKAPEAPRHDAGHRIIPQWKFDALKAYIAESAKLKRNGLPVPEAMSFIDAYGVRVGALVAEDTFSLAQDTF